MHNVSVGHCQTLFWVSLNRIYRFRLRSLDHIFKYPLPTCIGITKGLLCFKHQNYDFVRFFFLPTHIFFRMHSSWYQVSGCYIIWVQFDPRLRWPTPPTFKCTRFSNIIRPTQYFYNSFTLSSPSPVLDFRSRFPIYIQWFTKMFLKSSNL